MQEEEAETVDVGDLVEDEEDETVVVEEETEEADKVVGDQFVQEENESSTPKSSSTKHKISNCRIVTISLLLLMSLS